MSHSSAFPTAAQVTGNGAPGIVARIRAAVMAAIERRATRCAYGDLLEREDHIFDDIGLSRADVRRAARDL